MFLNRQGKLRLDAEAIAERIRNISPEEMHSADERKLVLKDAMNRFSGHLERMSESERTATLCILHGEMTNLLFEFDLSVTAGAAREQISKSATREGKLETLAEFRATLNDLAMIYGIA